jgi:predicted urease superfamily metal-dependent hydrolase
MILKRDGQAHIKPADVVALAVEVINVLTEHLSGKDSAVILHTQGESLQTLDIKSSAGSFGDGVRNVYKRVQPPKTGVGGDR